MWLQYLKSKNIASELQEFFCSKDQKVGLETFVIYDSVSWNVQSKVLFFIQIWKKKHMHPYCKTICTSFSHKLKTFSNCQPLSIFNEGAVTMTSTITQHQQNDARFVMCESIWSLISILNVQITKHVISPICWVNMRWKHTFSNPYINRIGVPSYFMMYKNY